MSSPLDIGSLYGPLPPMGDRLLSQGYCLSSTVLSARGAKNPGG